MVNASAPKPCPSTLNSVLDPAPASQSTWNNAVGPFSIPDAAAAAAFKIRFTGKSNAAEENPASGGSL